MKIEDVLLTSGEIVWTRQTGAVLASNEEIEVSNDEHNWLSYIQHEDGFGTSNFVIWEDRGMGIRPFQRNMNNLYCTYCED